MSSLEAASFPQPNLAVWSARSGRKLFLSQTIWTDGKCANLARPGPHKRHETIERRSPSCPSHSGHPHHLSAPRTYLPEIIDLRDSTWQPMVPFSFALPGESGHVTSERICNVYGIRLDGPMSGGKRRLLTRHGGRGGFETEWYSDSVALRENEVERQLQTCSSGGCWLRPGTHRKRELSIRLIIPAGRRLQWPAITAETNEAMFSANTNYFTLF